MQAHGIATGLGRKDRGDCITCPLHQSKYDICSGDVKEWSPFPILPMYGRMLAKMRKERPLEIHEVRDSEGWIEVDSQCEVVLPCFLVNIR